MKKKYSFDIKMPRRLTEAEQEERRSKRNAYQREYRKRQQEANSSTRKDNVDCDKKLATCYNRTKELIKIVDRSNEQIKQIMSDYNKILSRTK